MSAEHAVKERYAAASQAQEAILCCPVDYDARYLEVIPREVIERDYGCGDPSQFLKPGETVLDLGSGTGKICFIASQVVGENGSVIGVDMTDDMLDVATRNAPLVAERIGYNNVEFRKGRIQDLKLDLNSFQAELERSPVSTAEGWLEAEQVANQLRQESPMIGTASIDVVVSNCVLNLVETGQKTQMFAEIFRVLKKGGRAVISDIVADEEVPLHLQNDARLWSGCISGAMTERGFLKAFEEAGFYGCEVLKYETQPWQTVEGIEFRSMTVQAFKGKEGPCFEEGQALMYKGPFLSVTDDDEHTFTRGERIAVCEKTYQIYSQEPYRAFFERIAPLQEVDASKKVEFDCNRARVRSPRETKGGDYSFTSDSSQGCGEAGCC